MGRRQKQPAGHPPLNDFSAETLIERKRDTWPETSTPSVDAVIRLFRVRDIIYEESRQRVKKEFGLTRAEFEVIVTLRTVHPPYQLTPTQLQKSLLITPGGMTKVLHNLESRKLISRSRDTGDGRSLSVRLTQKGVALAEKVLPLVIEGYAEQLSEGLTVKQIEQLSSLLKRLLAALEPRSA